HDTSNIEFKKHTNSPRLMTSDGSKILTEAKTILNQQVKDQNLNFEAAKSNLQSYDSQHLVAT
ncbi:hypothetical protein BC941DRAFT_363110, partial [Chlamydoabsidia padenii]